MRVVEVRQFCKLDEAGDNLVRQAMSQLDLSAWGVSSGVEAGAYDWGSGWER